MLLALYFNKLAGRLLPNLQHDAGQRTTHSRKTHAGILHRHLLVVSDLLPLSQGHRYARESGTDLEQSDVVRQDQPFDPD